MTRWAYVIAPVGAVLLIGAWWAADQAIGIPEPDLGPAVVVSPRPAPPPTTAPPGPVQPVTPAPPPDAGDGDSDDDTDDADDDAD